MLLFPLTQAIRIYLFFIIFSSGFISCGNKKRISISKISEDSLAINHSLFNAKYRVKDISGKSYFQGYNKTDNEIILVEPNSGKEILKIKPLINFDDSAAGRFVQFDIYKADSIFVITENNIFIINAAGQIIYNKDLKMPLKDNEGVEVVFWDNDNQFPLYYDSKNSELLIRTICNCSFMSPEYFNRKIEAKLNLKSNQISFLDYGFPEKHRYINYGQIVFPFREVNDSLCIVSFQSNDSLYVINRNDNKVTKYNCRSSFQEIDFIPFDTLYRDDLERVKQHLTVSPIYQKILFDKYRNLYYRFFLKEQPLKNDKGIYSSIFDKEVIVMVLNKNFQIIDEKNLGNSYSWFFSFVTEKGLYVRRNNKMDKQYEYFTVFLWN